MPAPVTVVVATRNRRESLLGALAHLRALEERPPVIVVDNGSTDGTADTVRSRFPDVDVVALPFNRGSAARTTGVALATTPFVAFSDDDSWWAPGALAAAAAALENHPRLGLVAARVLVGPDQHEDPVCTVMARSPLPVVRDLPGQPVLGFVACGAVVRRSAFLEVGGFHAQFGIGGEEELLALDLAARGWTLAYVPRVVAHHHPAPSPDRARRQRVLTRNMLWAAWLRRSPAGAARRTLDIAARCLHDRAARGGAVEALRGLGWVARERRPVSGDVERAVRALGA